MGDGNRLSESFREVQQAPLQELPKTAQSAAPKPVEQKTTSVLQTFLAKVKGATTPNGAQRSHSTAPKSQTVKTLIKSVTNLFSSKIKCAFNKVQASPTENGMPSKLHSLFSKDGSLQRQRVLRDFEQTVLPMANAKNKSGSLEATASFLAKADKAGVLDQKLYNSMTRQLDKCLANPRESIVLDDSDSHTPKKTIHDLLLEVPMKSATLRTQLEKFAQVETNVQKFTTLLAEHANIKPEESRELVRKLFESYPTATEVTLTFGDNTVTAMLDPSDNAKPDVIIRGSYINKGAASVVHKAFSLRDQKEIVHKSGTIGADAAEEKRANDVVERVMSHAEGANGKKLEGIVEPLTLNTVQTAEGQKTIATGQVYDGDADSQIEAERFANCTRELEALLSQKESLGTIQDKKALDAFFQNYETLLQNKYGNDEVAAMKADLYGTAQ